MQLIILNQISPMKLLSQKHDLMTTSWIYIKTCTMWISFQAQQFLKMSYLISFGICGNTALTCLTSKDLVTKFTPLDLRYTREAFQ